jgi:hypothetical protein
MVVFQVAFPKIFQPKIYTHFVSPNRATYPAHHNPVAELPQARVYGRSLAGIEGSSPTGGMDVCLLWVLCVVR